MLDFSLCGSAIEVEFMSAFSEYIEESILPVAFKQQVYVLNDRLQTYRRCDFLLVHFGESIDSQMIAEMDGYAFHASTPEQFTKTCQRNRFYVNQGKWCIAFSGQELSDSGGPRRCASEALSILLGIYDREENLHRKFADLEYQFIYERALLNYERSLRGLPSRLSDLLGKD